MSSWIDIAGWTLVHFVWQGAAIASITAILLGVLRSRSPQARYAVACSALALMLAAPVVTAWVLSASPRSAITNSIHLLRSRQGGVVGVALAPPWSPASVGSSAPVPPAEFSLPAEIDTNTLFSAIVALWLGGVAVLLTRLGAGCWRVRQIQAAARLEPESRWQSLADEIAARLGMRRRFSVVDSLRVATPTVVGWLQPIVMLPVAALAGLSPRQVEAILAHELAHIRRHDYAINLLQTLAETVLFYHPAVWWVSARIRVEREHCCDDVAVAVCGDATEYAAALTELASWSIAHPPLAMAATDGPLITRVRRLLRLSEPVDRSSGRTTVVVAGVLTAAIGLGIFGVIVQAQPIGGADSRFGPPEMNRLLGFDLFPGPVRLPGGDPVNVRAWGVTVGNETTMTYVGFTARSMIRESYGLEDAPIVGAPLWMDDETFDIAVPADLTIVDGRPDYEQVRAAIKVFLEESLGLKTHRETRIFPAYALVLANDDGRLGPALKPSTSNCIAGGPPGVSAAMVTGPVLREWSVIRRFCGFDDSFFGMKGTRVTLAALAREFHRRGSPMAPDREIVDRTGLTGEYDFELRFGLLPLAAIGHAHPVLGTVLSPFGIRSVFTALPEQLGLKLVDATVSREVLVIDRIDRPVP